MRRALSLVAAGAASLLAACGDSPDARRPVNVTAALSDQIATVVTVHWTTAVPTTGYVEFGPTGNGPVWMVATSLPATPAPFSAETAR